ncbi:hypothetical protein MMC07_009546 [Pseudocyphellaria aurata]|nr:hypothetical protein [Pseudocyphellaria aurata]
MELNPDAWSIAAQLDRERAQDNLRGPLHGLPVLIKGNIGTRDQMQTNGKASLTEWSMFRSDNSSHGWNAVFGQTFGAYHLRQCPGGSSGGSAVASDLGLAWATIGTETSGSIVIPSERNNIVGIKPTIGLTSRYLVVPISEHQDTVGPMARTVEDAAKLLQVIAGVDPHDSYTFDSPFQDRIPDYPAACRLSGLQGKRIGIARNVIDGSSDEVSHVMKAFEDAVSVMADAGATIVENTSFTAFGEWKKRKYNPVTRVDFMSNLPRYLSQLERNPQNIHSVEDLRAFTRTFPSEEYPARNTSNWDTGIEQGILNTSAAFQAMYRANLHMGGPGGIVGALERHSLDAVALPSTIAADIPGMVGTPVISVPLGAASAATPVQHERFFTDVVETAPGIPFGISFLGAKWSEETLIEIAYGFEQKTRVRSTLARQVEPRVDLADVMAGRR